MTEQIIEDIKKEVSNTKKVRVAINGFGRIGRLIFRAGFNDPNIEFVAINDLSGVETARYMLQYDSAQGSFPHKVSTKDDYLLVGDKQIKILQEKDINNLPWYELNIDVVAECTGKFKDREQVDIHLKNGAKKVVISAPGSGDVFYLVRGVNDYQYKDEYKVVSNGSCTTNSMSSIINEVNNKFGIKKGMFATIHSYTGDQRVVDTGHSNLRRGRAAAQNIIPTSTGAAKAVIKLIPQLEGKLHGIAYRVPTITGSVTDINIELERETTTQEINDFLKEICSKQLYGIMEYNEDELVSSDIIGNTHSGIIDAKSTKVISGNLLKLVIWYDNEFGFSNRMIEVIKLIHK
ncbi:MAG: type I glyceraldehyde-3-phosphate dehydrogenase [Nanoarchaeota archaeon]